MDLQLETRQEGEVAVVAAAGEVDVFTAPGLDAAISAELAAGHPRLVVDLTGAREAGGSMHLVVTSDRIRKIFEITGLDSAMPLFDTVADAVTG